MIDWAGGWLDIVIAKTRHWAELLAFTSRLNMTKIFKSAALFGALTLAVAPAPVMADGHGYTNGAVITVSCFRGPWEEVIWDRPNAGFIDDLVSIGYTFPQAHAIGERVCRDESTVDNEAAARAVMLQILAQNPPG